MSEQEGRQGPPAMVVYLVNVWIDVAGTKVVRPGAYCEDQADAKALAQRLAAEAQQLANQPAVKQMMQLVGVSGVGTNIRAVPRHSPMAIRPPQNQLIVGKA